MSIPEALGKTAYEEFCSHWPFGISVDWHSLPPLAKATWMAVADSVRKKLNSFE